MAIRLVDDHETRGGVHHENQRCRPTRPCPSDVGRAQERDDGPASRNTPSDLSGVELEARGPSPSTTVVPVSRAMCPWSVVGRLECGDGAPRTAVRQQICLEDLVRTVARRSSTRRHRGDRAMPRGARARRGRVAGQATRDSSAARASRHAAGGGSGIVRVQPDPYVDLRGVIALERASRHGRDKRTARIPTTGAITAPRGPVRRADSIGVTSPSASSRQPETARGSCRTARRHVARPIDSGGLSAAEPQPSSKRI